ncbi:MAG: V-type ATPase subunit [Treponema sp.]|jgi:vacuolar-type H+-ATPase subunit C/Vma6|nr:V-type ATPase subunit [Treponema sp.]
MTGERAYIYAKTCGIIGKSFVGKRIHSLMNVNRLAEFDRRVFPEGSGYLPERELLPDLEKRITARSIAQIETIIGCFRNPPELLVLMLQSYEYENLKNVFADLANKEAKPLRITDIGAFRTINFEAYPDIESMLKNTEFAFLLDDLKGAPATLQDDAIVLQTKLDKYYYTRLYAALERLPRADRFGIEEIIDNEIQLRNVSWTLRLRTYYNMNVERIKTMLITIDGKKDLTSDALASCAFSLDVRNDWAHWKWAEFVNSEITAPSSSYWTIDPRYFQNKASQRLYKCTYQSFHAKPFSLLPAFCFIRLKQSEEDLLTSIAEGFGFGLPCRETLRLLGAAS